MPQPAALAGVRAAFDASTAASPPLWTALRYLAFSRVVVSGLLALLFTFGDLSTMFDTAYDRQMFARVAWFYLTIALVFVAVVVRLPRAYLSQMALHVGTDLVLLVLLIHFAGGPRSGLGVLVVIAIAGAAVLASQRLAIAFAALASLLLLAEAATRTISDDSLDIGVFFAAGLIGAVCFASAIIVNWLATRLEREERLAIQRGEELRRQLAVTQLVIAELAQGMLVVGRDGHVQTLNRVATALLGPLDLASRSMLDPRLAGAWSQVAKAFRDWLSWRGTGVRPEAIELALLAPAGGTTPTKVKLRFLSVQDESPAFTPDRVGDDVVLVIEDLRALEERAQQLKLASMGRLSASIAHEIRNPLGAIRHANSLLAEQLSSAPMQRLAGIVETNTVRINRIIEDVLSISRREPPTQEAIDLQTYLPAFLAEFSAIAALTVSRIDCSIEARTALCFDANHLRQVLVNILGNGLRYASTQPAAIRIRWQAGADERPELSIADDGPGLAPEVLQHLFEPFLTTEARGTGLGLYLARELCAANFAVLRYDRSEDDQRYRGAFVIESLNVSTQP